ncbi:MAG: hybrid sensor histidine kinase/response regulator [Magnetococcales bacterium]|nr:hybrid sensor histidine kinase/response regulator [Magnetococcales bacterium]
MITNQSEILESTESSILLVDDQPEQIDIIKSALEQHFIVKVAVKGKLVFQICRTGVIDLILLDVMMPGMNGYDICRQLKNNPATLDIPVIFLTSRDTQNDETIGLQLGAVDFIRKPSSPAVVLTRCRNTISNHRAKIALNRKNDELQLMLLELQKSMKIRDDVELISRHDLKGPLSSIIGFPELLLEDDNLTEQQRKFIKRIEQSGYTLLEMINKSLDIFKMENCTYILQAEEIDLLVILKKIVYDLEIKSGHKGVHIDIGGEDGSKNIESFIIVGEKMLCYPLFYNLILNAVEASCKNGKIGIHLTTNGGFGTIQIINSGEVPHGIREHFFDKYITSGKEDGTGLGTYSAWLAAKTQGGKIDLDTGQTGGTAVIVTLPCPP